MACPCHMWKKTKYLGFCCHFYSVSSRLGDHRSDLSASRSSLSVDLPNALLVRKINVWVVHFHPTVFTEGGDGHSEWFSLYHTDQQHPHQVTALPYKRLRLSVTRTPFSPSVQDTLDFNTSQNLLGLNQAVIPAAGLLPTLLLTGL